MEKRPNLEIGDHLVLSGGVMNVATLVGFITLFGIAVRNGILLVSHYNYLLAEGVPLAPRPPCVRRCNSPARPHEIVSRLTVA